jgi:hypothetical protein
MAFSLASNDRQFDTGRTEESTRRVLQADKKKRLISRRLGMSG